MRWNGPMRCRKFKDSEKLRSMRSALADMGHFSHVFPWFHLYKVGDFESVSPEKTQRILGGSNPGPLDYKSNTLPLSHTGTKTKQYACSNAFNLCGSVVVRASTS